MWPVAGDAAEATPPPANRKLIAIATTPAATIPARRVIIDPPVSLVLARAFRLDTQSRGSSRRGATIGSPRTWDTPQSTLCRNSQCDHLQLHPKRPASCRRVCQSGIWPRSEAATAPAPRRFPTTIGPSSFCPASPTPTTSITPVASSATKKRPSRRSPATPRAGARPRRRRERAGSCPPRSFVVSDVGGPCSSTGPSHRPGSSSGRRGRGRAATSPSPRRAGIGSSGAVLAETVIRDQATQAPTERCFALCLTATV